jgi:O-antigen/teichoic acid export membrane protein
VAPDRLAHDVAANVLGKLWSGMIGVVLAPLYVHVLGIESYGLVAVYTTLRNLFVVLDLGLTTTLSRELARRQVDGLAGARDLVRTLEAMYWGLAVVIAAVCALLAPWIARNFVRAEVLSASRVETAVRLMGVVIAFEWLLSFYAGGLMSVRRQVLYNACYAGLSTLRYAGVLLVFRYVSASIEAFFLWQAVVGLFGAALLGRLLWVSLPRDGPAHFRGAVVRSVWHFAAGMTAVAVTGLFLSQLDRIILARLVSLPEFGYYGLALVGAGALYGVINPIHSAVFPRLAAAAAAGDEGELKRQYHRSCQLMSVAVIPVAAVIALFSSELLRIWTRDPVVAGRTEALLRVMIVSTALNGLLTVPNSLLLAHGNIRIPLVMHVAAILVLTPLTVWATLRYGVLGATVGWALYNVASVVVGMHFVHAALLPFESGRWYRDDVARPALAALAVAVAGRLLLPAPHSALAVGAATLGSLLLAAAAAARVTPEVWRVVRGGWTGFLAEAAGA